MGGALAFALIAALAAWFARPVSSPRRFSVVGSIDAGRYGDAGATDGVRVGILDTLVRKDAVFPSVRKEMAAAFEQERYQQMIADRTADYSSEAERAAMRKKIESLHAMGERLSWIATSQSEKFDVLEVATDMRRDVVGAPHLGDIVSSATLWTGVTTRGGSFSIPGIAPGKYYVHAIVRTASRYLEWIVGVSVTDHDATVALSAGNATVSVPARDAD